MGVMSLLECALELHHAEHALAEAPQRIVEEVAGMLLDTAKDMVGSYQDGWPQLAASTVARKGADTPLLTTGAFRDSISMEIGHHEAWVGSADQRATWFELGTSRMPARPVFAAALAQSEKRIEVIAKAEMARALAAGRHHTHELMEALHALKEIYDHAKEAVHDLSEASDEQARRR